MEAKMQSLELLRNQITAINDLSGITGALEQIAAKNMMNTRQKILKSRSFFDETWKVYGVLRQLAPVAPDVKDKDLVIVISLNQGMCGNLLNKVVAVGKELYKDRKADLLITGKKGHSHFADFDQRTIHFFSIPDNVTYAEIEPIKKIVSGYSQVRIVYPRYYSTANQQVEVATLVVKAGEDSKKPEDFVQSKRFRIEPDLLSVVNYFNKTIMGALFYSYFAESVLAYNAAQMVAMRNAHDNADEMDKKITFSYKKLRREIVDVKLRELHKFRFLQKEDDERE
jgi:F-type H+-transporting ATPase subunit gamma